MKSLPLERRRMRNLEKPTEKTNFEKLIESNSGICEIGLGKRE